MLLDTTPYGSAETRCHHEDEIASVKAADLNMHTT